jgi:hypothetical protein
MNPKVRRLLGSCITIAGLAAALALGQGARAETLDVNIDQAKIAKIPTGTATLVVGNPIVADVTMLKSSGAMVVTGKGFGQTNLIALDAEGNVLDEKMIQVQPTSSVMVVQRGMDRESYSCTPTCMPSVQLGDGKQFGDASSQITARNALEEHTQQH